MSNRPLIGFCLASLVVAADAGHAARPNVVIILADDMGYGDIRALNADSRIPTPNLDQLASDGVTFTDAHSPSAVCTPTRYGLLTGRYCWRTQLTQGVLGGYSPPLIEDGRATIGTLLQANGYRTGAVGKWHLGMTLPMHRGRDAINAAWDGDPGVDFSGVIADGPLQRGFEFYFGVSASLDMAPYVYIRNDRFTMQPTIEQPAVPFPHFVRHGPRSADFELDEVLDKLTQEAVAFIEAAAEDERPFFLYLPLTAPHKPTQPHGRFRGRTQLGDYGDFVAQVDWTVGGVLKAIDRAGARENTLVFYASDNGSYMYRYDEPSKRDHVDDPGVQGYRANRHRANGPFRGTKADIWEGGHHVPLIASWPGQTEPGSKCAEPVCLTDLFATIAELIEAELDNQVAEDSFSLLPMLRGEDHRRGAPVVHHSADGMFAVRHGKWKLVLGTGSGGREEPKGTPFDRPYQLFDLSSDIAETANVAEQHSNVVDSLVRALMVIRERGRSVDRTASH